LYKGTQKKRFLQPLASNYFSLLTEETS